MGQPSTENKVMTNDTNGLCKIPDEPGKYMRISKRKLLVDSDYQRELQPSKAEEFGTNWKWAACGALTVEVRADGKSYLTDGMHRWSGAMMRPDIDKLPCIVFPSKGSKQEAATFLLVNTHRKPLTAVDRHKARVHSGDKHACLIQRLADNCGRVVRSETDRHSVGCVHALYKFAQRNAKVLEASWPTITKLQENRSLDRRLTMGLLHIAEQGTDLSERDVSLRLRNLGAGDLITAINKWIEASGKSGPSVWGAAIRSLHNRGLRTRKMKD